MSQTEKMRAFIIRFLYIIIWTGIIYAVLKYALPLFMPFVLAFIIAFTLKPLINFISSKTKIGRKPIAVLVLIITYIILACLLTLLGVKLVVFLGGLFKSLPAYYMEIIEPALTSTSASFDKYFSNLDPAVVNFIDSANKSIADSLSNIITSISRYMVSVFTGFAGKVPYIIIAFMLTIIASFFFVVDYYKVTGFIKRQLSAKTSARLHVIRDFVINVLFKFARSYAIILSITFIEVSIGLFILGVNSSFFIAFAIAMVDILPILGTGTIIIPWSVYSLITGNYFLGIGLLILYAVITVIRQILEPKIVGKNIGLYPLLTLICMFVGARMFGFWGMFAMPITLTVIIHLNKSGEIKVFKE